MAVSVATLNHDLLTLRSATTSPHHIHILLIDCSAKSTLSTYYFKLGRSRESCVLPWLWYSLHVTRLHLSNKGSVPHVCEQHKNSLLGTRLTGYYTTSNFPCYFHILHSYCSARYENNMGNSLVLVLPLAFPSYRTAWCKGSFHNALCVLASLLIGTYFRVLVKYDRWSYYQTFYAYISLRC